jgi:hypothetical protein
METMKRWIGMALVSALFWGLAPAAMAQEAVTAGPTDPAALWKAIPADATAFIALRDLKELNDDVQKSWQNLKLPENVVPNLVDLVRGSLQFGPSFNETGGVAVVVLSLAEVKSAEEIENRITLFFPSKDPEAMSKAMGGEKDGDAIKLEFMGEPSVVGTKEGYLIVAKDAAALKSALQTKGGVIAALSPERQKVFSQSDIYGWGNFRGVSKELRDTVREQMEQAMSSLPPPLMAMQKGNIEQFNQLLEEGQEAGFGLSLDPKRGLSGHFYMSMKPDSKMGKEIAGIKPTDGSLLIGLPNEPTILAVGTVAGSSSGDQLKQVFDGLLGAEGIEESVDKAKLTKVRDLLIALLGSLQKMSVGVSGLPAEGGEGMIGVSIVGEVRNADEFKKQARELFTVAKELAVDAAKKSGESEEDVKKVADAIQWKENAEKLGGANVDQLSFDLSKAPGANEEDLEQAKKIIGKEGVLVRIGSIGQNRVMVTFGGGARRFETLAGAAGKGDAPLAEHADIKKVADRLPTGPKFIEGYINIEHLFALIMDIDNEVDGGIPFPLALRNSAPIAFTGTKVGEAGQQVDVVVPMELLRSLADMVRPLLGAFMGGAPGPAPEAPQPPAEPGKLE